MKKLLFGLIAISLLAVVCCQDESGIEKEKRAIKAVIEREKIAYYLQDLSGMDDSWIQEASSRKLFMTPHGITELEGWTEIQQHNLEESERERNQAEESALYSNFTINVYDNTALVFHDSNHMIKDHEDESILKMRRILHMVKVDEEWKIDLMAMYFIPFSQRVEETES
jgi:hypothetical protein